EARSSGRAWSSERNHCSPASSQVNGFQDHCGIATITERHMVKFDLPGERGQKGGTGRLSFFFFLIQIGEYLLTGALRILELLIDLADTLQRHVGVKHRIEKRKKHSLGH